MESHEKSWKIMMISRNFFYKNAKFLQNGKFFILVSIHKSCTVYFEKKYVVPIGHGNSFFGHGKSLLKKSGHPVIIYITDGQQKVLARFPEA